MKKILSIIAICLGMVSCVDTVILPDDKIVDEDYWQTKSDVAGIVAAAYNQLMTEDLQRNLIVWGDFRSDELQLANSVSLTNTTVYVQDLNQVYSLNILPSNAFTNWNNLYSAINYCNLVIAKAQGVVSIDPNYTEGDYKADIARVKALRALCYFYLVRVFRDVPVSTEAYMNDSQERELEQKAPAEVLEMCINDLKEVEPDALFSNTYGDWRDKGYMTRDAIHALLADIYLWRASVNQMDNPEQAKADYEECVAYCDKVIASKKNAHVMLRGEQEKDYYLADCEDYYDDVFGSNTLVKNNGQVAHGMNSEESIMEIQHHSYNSTEGLIHEITNTGIVKMYYKFNGNNNAATSYFMTTANYGVYSGNTSGTNIFKIADDVRQNEFIFSANSGQDQFAVRKFVAQSSCQNKVETTGPDVKYVFSNWILYRLTDIMLMKAEALVQLNELTKQNAGDGAEEGDEGDGSESVDYLQQAFNLVYAVNRRALPETSTNVLKFNVYKDRMESLVLQERARELCFEGKRWFDLMRYNYRHVSGVQYDKTFDQQGGNYVPNYSEMLTLAMTAKYSSVAAMASKMPTEPYLYWPINSGQMDLNTKLKQNPVWKASSSTARK